MSVLLHSDPDTSSNSSDMSEEEQNSSIKGVEQINNGEINILSTSIMLSPDSEQQQRQALLNSLVPTSKITIRFKPIGSTPSINPKIFKISASQSVATISKFLSSKLRLPEVYLYISNSFQPNPDENLGELFNNFSTNSELIINYCNSIAFG